MPPKGSRKTHAPGPSASALAIADSSSSSLSTTTTNTKLLAEAQDHVDDIKKVFRAIASADPVGVQGGGTGAAFDLASYQSGMKNNGEYFAHINLFWVDPTSVAMAGVPIRIKAVDELLASGVARGQYRFPSTLHIAVDSRDYNPLEHRGALKRVSPPEEFLAYLKRVAAAVKEAHENNRKDELKAYKTGLLDCPARFTILQGPQDRWWYEYNMREKIGLEYRTMYQTAYQRVCGLTRVVAEQVAAHGRDAGSVSKIVQLYEARAQLPLSDEGPTNTESFIRSAFVVKDGLLNLPVVREVMELLDEQLGHVNPLDSVHKLACVKRATETSTELREWVMQGLADNILAGCEAVQQLPMRDMQPSKYRCIPQCYVLKKHMLDYLLSKSDQMYHPTVAAKMRELFVSHATFREKYRPVSGRRASADLTFLSVWPPSARMFADFVAQLVFSHEPPLAATLQAVAKAGKAMSSIFEQGACSEAWDAIANLRQTEKQQEGAAAAAAAAGAAPQSQEGSVEAPLSVEAGEEDAGEGDAKTYWRKYAEETVRGMVTLLVTPSERETLVEQIKQSPVFQLKEPTPGPKSILTYYDEKLASEAASQPWGRKCPSRKVHLAMCIGACLDVHQKVKPGYLYILPDHGKLKNANMFKELFKVNGSLQCHMTNYDIHVDETSLRSRKRFQRSPKLLEQTEKMIVFCHDAVSIPDNPRTHFSGTNRGRSWGFVKLDPHEALWQVRWDEKEPAYGDAIRPVGGKIDDADDDEDATVEEKPIKADSLVPFCWHGWPKKVFDELLSVNCAIGVYDFTPGDGHMAKAVLERGGATQYVAWCHTEAHCLLLRNLLTDFVFQGMTTEGHPLYNVRCASKAAGKSGQQDTVGKGTKRNKDDNDKKRKTAKKNKDEKAAGKKKKKAGKRSKQTESSSEPACDDEDSSSPAESD